MGFARRSVIKAGVKNHVFFLLNKPSFAQRLRTGKVKKWKIKNKKKLK